MALYDNSYFVDLCATVYINYQSYYCKHLIKNLLYLPCPTQILLVPSSALPLTNAFVAALVDVGFIVFGALIIAVSDRMKPCFVTYVTF